MKTTNKYYMSFEESQEYVSKRGLDVPWNDCDVFIDEREITRTVGNVLKWGDETMIDKACYVFCHTGCPHKTDSYSCLKDKCDTWKRFRRMMEE